MLTRQSLKREDARYSSVRISGLQTLTRQGPICASRVHWTVTLPDPHASIQLQLTNVHIKQRTDRYGCENRSKTLWDPACHDLLWQTVSGGWPA